MKYGRPVATILLLGGVITYFSINNNFEQALSKEQLKLTSEVSALSGEVITLESQLSGVRYQLLQKQNKLTLLNNLNGTKPIVQDKTVAVKEVVKDETKAFGKCITNEDEPVSYEGVERNYADYVIDYECTDYAGADRCYRNSKESCILFESPERYEERLSN